MLPAFSSRSGFQILTSVLMSGSVALGIFLARNAALHHAPMSLAEKVAERPVVGVTIVNAEASVRSHPVRTRLPKYTHGSTTLYTVALAERKQEAFESERAMLLARSILLTLPPEVNLPDPSFLLSLAEYPSWIIPTEEQETRHATFDTSAIERSLESIVAPLLPGPEDVRIKALSWKDSAPVLAEGKMQDGWVLEAEKASHLLTAAITTGQASLILPVRKEEGRILNATPFDIGSMQLLSRGRSNFAGSPGNRIFNVEKALEEHINNILILPGSTFSFNDMIGQIDSTTGWKLALGIFNGTDLAFTPGGGVCQSSTTLYRSVLQAGLPVLKQQNHSLYVTYYGKHGEGLDATIYPGTQDFSFLNDTQYPILIQARREGNDAIVELYGTPDGRHVTLEGPYRWYDAPDGLLHPSGRELYKNEIAWKQHITKGDGTETENVLVSRYLNSIPGQKPEGADIL